MNWTIYCIECVARVALFTGAIMIPLCRNPVWWIHDYPADIQEKYCENHERIPTKTLSVPVLLKKGFALLLCVAVFVGLALLAGAKGPVLSSEKISCNSFAHRYGVGLGSVPCMRLDRSGGFAIIICEGLMKKRKQAHAGRFLESLQKETNDLRKRL